MLDQQEIESQGKRGAAYHEAGHVVAYSLLGGSMVRAQLRKNDSLCESEVRWIGTCQSLATVAPREEAIASMAGVCSEAILEYDEVDSSDIVDWLDCQISAPSPSDWQGLAGLFKLERFTFDDWIRLMQKQATANQLYSIIDNTMELLRRNWALVEAVATHLIENDSVTDWELSNILKGINRDSGIAQ